MADGGRHWSKAFALEGRDSDAFTTFRAHLLGRPEEVGMALPKIVLRGRKIILLSGFKDEAWDKSTKHRKLVVDAEDKLRLAAKANPDACAFGYIAGEWVASA